MTFSNDLIRAKDLITDSDDSEDVVEELARQGWIRDAEALRWVAIFDPFQKRAGPQ